MNAAPKDTDEGPRYWVGVVSAEHVARGVDGGFAQLCHGKAAPLRRMRGGDWLIYYSPAEKMCGGEPVQAFTAIGRIAHGPAYEFDMGGGFVPFRRDVRYLPCQAAPIRPLLPDLGFLPDKSRWGYAFRFGHLQIPRDDFLRIAEAMGVDAEAIDRAAESDLEARGAVIDEMRGGESDADASSSTRSSRSADRRKARPAAQTELAMDGAMEAAHG